MSLPHTAFQRFVGLVLTILATGPVTACGGPANAGPAAPPLVAIVAPVTAAEARLPIANLTTLIREHVTDTAGEPVDGARVVVVTDEGTPALVGAGALTDLPQNSTSRRETLDRFVAEIAAAASGATPTTPEANPVEAVAVAVRSLRGTLGGAPATPARCTVLLGTNGFSTAGALQLQAVGTRVDVRDAGAAVVGAGALPDLTGCTVVLLNLGSGAGAQETADQSTLRALTDLYTAIFTEAGAVVEVAAASVTEQPPGALPPVTPVPVGVPPVTLEAATTGETCSVDVPDALIGFVPDSAQVLDQAATDTAVAGIAAAVRGCAGQVGTLQVVGTTSSAGDAAGRLALSQLRAQYVASRIATALGLPESAVSAVGIGHCETGTTSVTCTPDRTAGVLDLMAAVSNRRAVVLVG